MSGHGRSERRALRLLSGELDAEQAAELRRRAAQEPALARELERLERTWRALDDAPAVAVPPGFAGRVLARVREEERRPRLSWPAAPVWARAAGVVALVLGLAAGAGLGAGLAPAAGSAETPPAAESRLDDDLESLYTTGSATLAEDYADLLSAFEGGEES